MTSSIFVNRSAVEATELKCAVQTYRQLVPSTQLVNKPRSQTILPSPPSGGGTLLPISTCPQPTTAAQSLSILSPNNIPTLAVTPVSSTTPNIVIDQYPTILRVVSFEEMNVHSEIQAATPTLTQRSTHSGKKKSPKLIRYGYTFGTFFKQPFLLKEVGLQTHYKSLLS